jgi:hypothetical protein
MSDGRFNRPATAESLTQSGFKKQPVNDLLELSGHEFEARYRHVQQLEYIRRCRVKPRGPGQQMRLLISPFGLQPDDHHPRDSKRGLPLRKGLNRSLDKLRPLSPEMNQDFDIKPNAFAQVRSEFGYRNPRGYSVKTSHETQSRTNLGGVGANSSSASLPISPIAGGGETEALGMSGRPSTANESVHTCKAALASTHAAGRLNGSIFSGMEQYSSTVASEKLSVTDWNSSTQSPHGRGYWVNWQAHADGHRVGDAPHSVTGNHCPPARLNTKNIRDLKEWDTIRN